MIISTSRFKEKRIYEWIRFLSKPQKPQFWAIYWDFLGPHDQPEFIFQDWTSSLFLLHDYLTSRKKLEKNNDPVLGSCVANGRTDGRSNRAKFIGIFRYHGCPNILVILLMLTTKNFGKPWSHFLLTKVKIQTIWIIILQTLPPT